MDSSAITVAQDNNIPIIVFSIAEKNCLIKTLSGKNKYTRIS
jgi:uridylate kinase